MPMEAKSTIDKGALLGARRAARHSIMMPTFGGRSRALSANRGAGGSNHGRLHDHSSAPVAL